MTEPMRRFCLVGARGVGKTTLVRSVIARLPHVDYVVGSAVLRELAGPEFVAFDALPLSRKEHFREEAIRWMERRQRDERRHLLCDGHVTLLNSVSGVVEDVFTELDRRFFSDLLLLEAPVEVVLGRRRNDPSKSRSLDRDVIAREIQAEREACERLAASRGLRLDVFSPAARTSAADWLVGALAR